MPSKSFLYIGVDPSITNTGVVALTDAGELVGSFNSKSIPACKGKTKRSKKEPGYEWLRLADIADGVVNFIEECREKVGGVGKDHVVCGYEHYSFDSVNLSYTTGELGGVLKLALAQRGIDIHLVQPTRLKKFATGSGHATKDKMQDEAQAECTELKGATDDVCDAYFLAKFAWYLHEVQSAAKAEKGIALLRHRLEVIKDTKATEAKRRKK